MSERTLFSRRSLLTAGLAAPLSGLVPGAAAAAQIAPKPVLHDDPWHGLKVGIASYTLRTLPRDAAVAAIKRVGVHYCSIKDSHLPLTSTPDERKAVAQQFKDAGITPLSCGNIGLPNNEAGARKWFDYAKDAGLPTMVCSPNLDSLDLMDKLVKEYDIRLAIHNHGPGDKYPSPFDVWKAIQGHDTRIGLCIDVGHTARAGVDPADAILKCHERLYDVHLKDVTRLAPNGGAIEVGRGVLDIKAIMQALVQVGYTHDVGFEYEKDAKDPVPGMFESVGYVRGIMNSI